MANPEHLAILNKGVEEWNRWRKNHPEVTPDFIREDLAGKTLSGVDLKASNLSFAKLANAHLHGANLSWADLHATDLTKVDLRNGLMIGAVLRRVNLTGADLHQVEIGETVFADLDLSETNGLESCVHLGPSSIDVPTLLRSRDVPRSFLQGCGLPDRYIDHMPSLKDGIDFYSCFISYSTTDQEFAVRLHADLQDKGVRCWFAPEDLKIGDPFRQRIDESIRLHDKLLLIVSKHSVQSTWVEDEVEAALERERREKRLVLLPIRIDDAVRETGQAWAAFMRRKLHIGDFSNWKDHDSYQKAFQRLLRDLKAEGEKG